MSTRIITHRGLDPSRKDYFSESTREAFVDQLGRGFGLEFDVQFSKDNVMLAVHDPTLSRITRGRDERALRDVVSSEILAMNIGECHLATVGEVLSLIDSAKGERISALHLKAAWQDKPHMDLLLAELQSHNLGKFFVFDLKPEPARYLKQKLPALSLGVSIAHPYDIARYNQVTGGTLLSLREANELQGVVDWAWLDEWDRTDESRGGKKLYTKETFDVCKSLGLRIAVISPELHASSPGLLGGEVHQDAQNHEVLVSRVREILGLYPDAYCTDLPDMVQAIAAATY